MNFALVQLQPNHACRRQPPRVTAWDYDTQRGWLTQKHYPDKVSGAEGATGPEYTYTAAGRLKTRKWLRNGSDSQRIVTTYSYGFEDLTQQKRHGDLLKVAYSATVPATPLVTYDYDRLGRRSQAVQQTLPTALTTTFTYNDANLPLTESYSGGMLNGLSVNQTYFNTLKRDALSLGGVAGYSVSHTYDTAGRLATVSQGSSTTTYGYVPNSMLVQQITSAQGAVSLTTTKDYDALNRLKSISSVRSVAPMPISYAYRYNAANQRDRVTLADNSYWDYGYDALGQVTSGKRKWQDNSFVAGQQYEYTFDEIGNRTQTKVGGDANGANLRPAGYTPNLLNQYADRAVPGTVDVLGLGVPATAVSVNGNTASRKGEYFHYALPAPNSGAAQYTTVTVVSGAESSSGKVFVPQNPEVFAHDLDGNLTSDGRWNYTWDAENRLVKVESLATAPAGSRRRLELAYDFIGRRIWKKLTNLDTSAVTEERFLYDGWNLVAVLSPSSATILKSFVWGTDLSGSSQGAGGVGGLLKVNQVAAPASSSFVGYDGNGNVAGLIDAANGSIAAQYEYGPFGEVIRATGPMAKANPFRFSTKYQDDETDLVYYGVRYLKTSTGGWLSRDPIGEKGGLNLYGFVRNDPISLFDKLGQNIGIPTCGYGCVPPPTCASPDSTDCGIFADLLNRWRTGQSGPYELPSDAMDRMMGRGLNKTDIDDMKNLLRRRCRQYIKRPTPGLMDQLADESFTSAGAECEAWYLGGHTRTISGVADCCSGRAQICLEVTDKFDFDEQDPWPSGGIQDKIKYLGSICTGAILNFPYPTWSYANIPVHGKKCIQVKL